ncbi:MAG: FGGY-family carbohydrate kinase, partial [Geminicoccaceae bacterium]
LELNAALLPPICQAGGRIGTIRPEIAAATGLPDDCIVGVGGHDHVCGMFAVGADRAGVLLDSIGTAEALTLVTDMPLADCAIGWDGFNQGAFDAGRPLFYMFGGLPTAAASVEWFRAAHGGADHATLIAEAESADPAEQALFLPHLRLGSPPFPDPVGRGAFLGLSSTTSRGALFRSVLEGIALDGGNMLKIMGRHLGTRSPDRIVAIGGSTKNRLLMRLKASVYGARLGVVDLPDATCLGAALLGGLAAGLFRDLDEARAGLRLAIRDVEPDPSWSEEFRERRLGTYAAAYAALRPLHARLLDE